MQTKLLLPMILMSVIALSMILLPLTTINMDDITVDVDTTIYEEPTQYAPGFDSSDFSNIYVHQGEGQDVMMDPPNGVWEILLALKFDIRFDAELDDVIFEPKFTKKIKELAGTSIELEGFIIPNDIANISGEMDDKGQRFMFSAFPLANCFFCGGAGAESVVEVFPKNPINYSKDKITVKGKLKLNSSDFLRLPYILEDVEQVF